MHYVYLFQSPPEQLKKVTVESKARIMPQSKGRRSFLKLKQNFWSRAWNKHSFSTASPHTTYIFVGILSFWPETKGQFLGGMFAYAVVKCTLKRQRLLNLTGKKSNHWTEQKHVLKSLLAFSDCYFTAKSCNNIFVYNPQPIQKKPLSAFFVGKWKAA